MQWLSCFALSSQQVALHSQSFSLCSEKVPLHSSYYSKDLKAYTQPIIHNKRKKLLDLLCKKPDMSLFSIPHKLVKIILFSSFFYSGSLISTSINLH